MAKSNLAKMKRLSKTLEKAYELCEPFSIPNERRAWVGDGLYRLRSEIKSALDSLDRQIESGRG